jgi:hypothetical protein
MQSGLERGFRYFKVSPIKVFRDIRHVSGDKVFQLADNYSLEMRKNQPSKKALTKRAI